MKLPNPGDVVKSLAASSVSVSSRVGGVRISPHFYNTEEEVEIFLEKMKKLGK